MPADAPRDLTVVRHTNNAHFPRPLMARAAISNVSVVGTQEVKGMALKKDGTRVPDVYTVRPTIVDQGRAALGWRAERSVATTANRPISIYRLHPQSSPTSSR